MFAACEIYSFSNHSPFNISVYWADVFFSLFFHTNVLITVKNVKTRVIIDFKNPSLELIVYQNVKSIDLKQAKRLGIVYLFSKLTLRFVLDELRKIFHRFFGNFMYSLLYFSDIDAVTLQTFEQALKSALGCVVWHKKLFFCASYVLFRHFVYAVVGEMHVVVS